VQAKGGLVLSDFQCGQLRLHFLNLGFGPDGASTELDADHSYVNPFLVKGYELGLTKKVIDHEQLAQLGKQTVKVQRCRRERCAPDQQSKSPLARLALL
jgi:hypothetical protein